MPTIKIHYFSDDLPRLQKTGKGDWIDLYAAQTMQLRAGDFALIPLGVSMQLPEGYEARTAPRSSTFKRWGILQANSVGVIDNSYCGTNDEWKLPVYATRDTVIEKGDRIALVGRNGEGKTTFARMLVGELRPTEGSIRVGVNVNTGYYAQNQDDLMNGDFTVYDTLDRVAVGDIRTRLRDILGAFLFRGEDIDKKVKVLSGGERSRLAMARMMLEPHNLLVLDEPTNHMDMRSKDILKNALLKYDGTLVVVSHDREFLDGLVDKVYEFRDGGVKEYLGGIWYFLEKRRVESMREIEARQPAASAPATSAS